MVADVYRPAGDGRYPALILLLGVNPLPRQHPQVTMLADGLARTGIVTVVAESEALLRGEIRPEEVDNLVALFTYLEADPGVDPDRMGFGGFCVGAVLEILAASDERIADHVAYVNGFSVYADARDVVRAVLSRSMPTPTGRVDWQPDAMTREVFVRHLILALPTSRDRAFLSRERVEGTPLTSPEVQALTPLGQELRDLLVATEPAEIDRRMAALPADYLATLDRLSPAASIGRLRAETFLMHDESDTYLPVSGARQLARLLPAAARGHYTEFHLFQHVVPGRTENSVLFAGEMVKLLQHVNAVLTVIRHGGAAASRLR
jgi:pimeloyl-ACP methyl ester carboxylesterase